MLNVEKIVFLTVAFLFLCHVRPGVAVGNTVLITAALWFISLPPPKLMEKCNIQFRYMKEIFGAENTIYLVCFLYVFILRLLNLFYCYGFTVPSILFFFLVEDCVWDDWKLNTEPSMWGQGMSECQHTFKSGQFLSDFYRHWLKNLVPKDVLFPTLKYSKILEAISSSITFNILVQHLISRVDKECMIVRSYIRKF